MQHRAWLTGCSAQSFECICSHWDDTSPYTQFVNLRHSVNDDESFLLYSDQWTCVLILYYYHRLHALPKFWVYWWSFVGVWEVLNWHPSDSFWPSLNLKFVIVSEYGNLWVTTQLSTAPLPFLVSFRVAIWETGSDSDPVVDHNVPLLTDDGNIDWRNIIDLAWKSHLYILLECQDVH